MIRNLAFLCLLLWWLLQFVTRAAARVLMVNLKTLQRSPLRRFGL